MLKIRRPLGRLIFNMGIAIPGKTVFLIETAPRTHQWISVTKDRYMWLPAIFIWKYISLHIQYTPEVSSFMPDNFDSTALRMTFSPYMFVAILRFLTIDIELSYQINKCPQTIGNGINMK